MNDAGLIASAAFVAPHEAVREKVKLVMGREGVLEVLCTALMEVLRARDQSGAYRLAGKIAQTDVSSRWRGARQRTWRGIPLKFAHAVIEVRRRYFFPFFRSACGTPAWYSSPGVDLTRCGSPSATSRLRN